MHFDDGWYTWVTRLARDAPGPVDTAVRLWSDYGLGLFAVLMVLAWWRARPAGGARSSVALAAPFVVVAAFAVNDAAKAAVHEQRPCQSLHVLTVEACPALGDWSFPSNHAAIAAAAAVALLLGDRLLGALAVPAALLMAASRVWVGAHYPHDVLAGLAVGAVVALVLTLLARRAAPLVDRLGRTRLRPLVAAR